MSSAGETEISGDEIKVEDSANGEGAHTYDGSRSGWNGNIGQSVATDDDEDNWSRQVETDDIIQRVPSSTGGETNTIDDYEDGQGPSTAVAEDNDNPEQQHQSVLIPQPRPLPTMKEKLVERERQRRVESERARWKRQFAMAAHAEAEHDEDDNNGTARDADTNGDNALSSAIADHETSFVTDRNSVAGTVGEDTVAPIDTLEEEVNNPNMTYPMERFLQDQQGTELEDNVEKSNQKETQGVVMERFLQEQPTAPANGFVAGQGESSHPSSLHVDSVPNESSVEQIIADELPLMDLPSNEGATNDLENELSGEPMGGDTFQSPSQQPRVVLRLTEAEIQEMAAIDDASRSNAPPSERDDMSELGELVSDFGTGLAHIDTQTMSQGTPVTAMESVTSSVGNQIGQITVLSGSSSDRDVIDGIEGHSISSNVVPSSAGGDVSLTGNPPSEVARDDDEDDDAGEILSPRSPQVPTEILPASTTVDVPHPSFSTAPIVDATIPDGGTRAQLELTSTNEIIVNRTMRPGLFNYKEQQQSNSMRSAEDSYTPEKNLDSTNQQVSTDVDNHIEGFDFDKDNYVASPQGGTSLISTRNELWSPGLSDSNMMPDYGAAADIGQNLQARNKSAVDDENKPLLGGIPPAVNVTLKNHRIEPSCGSLRSVRNTEDLKKLAQSVFNDIRSENTVTRLSISNEVEEYLGSTVLKRAFSERMLVLTVTLVLEVPTLLLISGGSDKLCHLIGRTKYTSLVALLPIVCALSGNVGLQASKLTKQAICHGQVKMDNYASWLVKEIGAAGLLGKRL
jgi:hypothetical protein